MPHLTFNNVMPGIVQALFDYPETAAPLGELAELLLRTDEELNMGERELIAARVSALNGCNFCSNSHLSASLAHHGLPHRLIDPISDDVTEGIELRPVVAALLRIAGKVQRSGKAVEEADVEEARALGATDRMIHDTVLIAAAFCMYNRYVDGLATLSPRDAALYEGIGETLARNGYRSLPVP